MKKLYAIIGAALLAMGSMASAKINAPHEALQLTPEGQARLNAAMASAQYDMENGLETPNTFAKTSWSDGSKTWSATLINSGALTEFFNVEGSEYYDYYCGWNVVLASVSQYDSTGSNGEEYVLALTYPNQKIWDYLVETEDGWTWDSKSLFGDEYDPDGLTPLSAWGNVFDETWYFYTPAAGDSGGVYLGFCSDGSEDGNPMAIINSTAKSGSYYYYEYQSMGYCTVTTNGTESTGGTTTGTSLKISNYDSDTESIDLTFEGGMTKTTNGSAIKSFYIPYSGEFGNRGMIAGSVKNMEIGEVHIINTGINNYDNNECYDVDWDADLTRYYIAGCHPTLTFKDSAFTKDSYTFSGSTMAATAEDYTFQYFYGAVYSSADATDPLNIWKGHYINVEGKTVFGTTSYETTNAPVADCFVYGGWNDTYAPFSSYDGLRIIDTDHYVFLKIEEDQAESEKPFIMNGTTDGFGIMGTNQYNEIQKVHFTGDVIYHYDSSDYTKTRTLASMGSIATPSQWNGGDSVKNIYSDAVNAEVTTDNGRVNITVAADTVVYIYNVAGQAVKSVRVKANQAKSIDLGNGLYIVKAGNKAVKVAL